MSCIVLLGIGASAASAETTTLQPWFHLTTNAKPAILPRGGDGLILVTAEDLGDTSASACTKVPAGTGKFTNQECEEEPGEPGTGEYDQTPIVMTVTLPEGVEPVKVEPSPGTPEPKVAFGDPPHLTGGLGAEEELPGGVPGEGRFHGSGFGPEQTLAFLHSCSEPAPRQVRCVFQPGGYASPIVIPYESLALAIAVRVAPGATSGAISTERISGGQASSVQTHRPLPVGAAGETPFGVEQSGFSIVPEQEGGQVDAQAGSHPFQLTTSFALNQTADPLVPPALPKDLTFDLPPGLVANAAVFPRCSESEFFTKNQDPTAGFGDECAQNTAVGVVLLTADAPGLPGGVTTSTIPVFNLVPKKGEPVRFGFFFAGIAVPIDFSIRTGRDYGAVGEVRNITQVANFQSESLTIWGVPGDPAHDESRGWLCVAGGIYNEGKPCPASGTSHPVPFLMLPTSCTSPFAASVTGDSWPRKPGAESTPEERTSISFPESSYSLKDGFEREVGLTGCNQLPFSPFIEVAPDVESASTSTGLKVDVKVPQEVSENAEGLASSAVKDITVALPEGVAVNPSGGNGLEACSEGLVGFQANLGENGFEEFPSEPGVKNPLFTPRLPGSVGALEAGETAPLQQGVNFCPDASKIGTVKIKTPLLSHELEGSVYLASQNANPFSSLIAAYIVAEDPVSGVLVKLPGEVALCKAAGEDPLNGSGVPIPNVSCQRLGQLISTFENEPELPFEDAELHFFGGERAPLTTPARCRENNEQYPGLYTTDASFAPWSGSAPVPSSSSFEISSGPNGGPCPGASLPFSPSVTGGATNLNAGAFSPFTLTLTRKDGEQNMQSVVAHLPLGMSGDLSNVEQCPEPQANVGKCGPNSLIGETTVSVGVGGDPYSVSGGKFYLTGPYNGTGTCTVAPTDPSCAPFGVTFEVPAKAGPFDLERNSANPAGEDACDCVIVRGKIEIDPLTAAITVTSNPPGTPYAIPTSIEGIPLEIQHINAITTRGNFQFNPTNCEPMAATGTIHSSEGNTDTLSVPFQVTNCADLKFEPKVAISTSGKTSKANGASLTYKLTYPKVPQGTDADIHYVKVELPKALPSRLTTLQKACTQKQFQANPAGCPHESVIGHAKAVVPNIPVPLEGPVYFVSNGGEAFPNLVIVLQGYNVRIDLVGDTFISKSGITSTTFKTVPDNPVYSFEITLPEGKFSALAANGNLCKLTTTKTVKKKVKVKVKGREKTVTKNVKQQVAAALQMPNEYIAQNGMKVDQTVPISVTGCGKAKAAKKTKKKKKKTGGKGKK